MEIFFRGETLKDKHKKLSDLEIENIIDKAINFSIIKKIYDLKLIDEKQYYAIKKKIENFYN